jgi:hypothetical protein
MNGHAEDTFERFARRFVVAYWETVKRGVIDMPPNEPVGETLEELLSAVTFVADFRRESRTNEAFGRLHMTGALGAWWHFEFQLANDQWQIIEATAKSDSETPRNLLGGIFSSFLGHVVEAANNEVPQHWE